MYKTSFNGLEISVKGVYSAYNLTPEELSSLKRLFGESNVNGSGSNYTVYKNHERKVFLKLFIHDIWKPISFDIRNDLLILFNSNRIFKKKIESISKELKNRRICLYVDYDISTNSWFIVKYDEFLNLLSEIINNLSC